MRESKVNSSYIWHWLHCFLHTENHPWFPWTCYTPHFQVALRLFRLHKNAPQGLLYIPPPPVLNTVQWHCVGWMLVLEVARPYKRWRFSRWTLDDIQQLRNTLEELHSINTDNSKCLQASSHISAHSVAGLLNPWYTPRWRVRFSFFSANAQFSVHKRTSTVPTSVVWRR